MLLVRTQQNFVCLYWHVTMLCFSCSYPEWLPALLHRYSSGSSHGSLLVCSRATPYGGIMALLIPRDRLRLNSMLSSWCSHTGTLPSVLSDFMAFLLFPPILICSDWGLMSFFFALPKHILVLPQSVADGLAFP